MVFTSLTHTYRLAAYPSKEGMRCTRPKVYHSVDDDGSRDVSPLDFFNPLERGATTVAGYASWRSQHKSKKSYYQLYFLRDFWISAAGGGEIYPASRNPEILGKSFWL